MADLKITQKAMNVALRIILDLIANSVLKPCPTFFTLIWEY